MATWDDAPHLSEEEKDRLMALIPLYQRDARTKGIPQLGSGAIYPISENKITVDDFPIPIWYKRIYGLDVGWNWTAAVWLAENPDDKVAYIYSVYKQGMAEPPVHAQAINARGDWIPGAIDPNSVGSGQIDGRKIVTEYQALLNNLMYADKAVEAGILRIWNRLSDGTLKVFASCLPWFQEFRLYRRDEHGKIVKKNDHLMDATRYGESKIELATTMPDMEEMEYYSGLNEINDSQRNSWTGY